MSTLQQQSAFGLFAGTDGKHPSHRMHRNSLAAHDPAKLDERSRAILADIERNGAGTDRQIAARMGFEHRSYVQPRISDMVKAGVLREVGAVKDDTTGKTVRIVDLT